MIAVLGAFDGFHKGHALLLDRARSMAESSGVEWGVVTFEPHPGVFMRVLDTTLFTSRERELIRLFMGIPRIVSLRFDAEVARFSPSHFWKYLNDRIHLDGIVVGKDFRFGYRRTGDIASLEDLCRENGIPFAAVDIAEHLGGKISSSTIRRRVEAGDCERAICELGYPYFIWAEVRHGLQRGRKLGFPTANLDIPRTKLLPPDGVYATAVLVGGEWKGGALSLGRSPTFGDVEEVRAEVFILDYSGSLYGESLVVFFLSHLRAQQTFKAVEQLILQMEADVARTRGIFERSFVQNPDWYRGPFAGYVEILNKLEHKK